MKAGGKDFVWKAVWQSATIAFIYFSAFLLKQRHRYKPFCLHTGHLEWYPGFSWDRVNCLLEVMLT